MKHESVCIAELAKLDQCLKPQISVDDNDDDLQDQVASLNSQLLVSSSAFRPLDCNGVYILPVQSIGVLVTFLVCTKLKFAITQSNKVNNNNFRFNEIKLVNTC